MSRVKRGPKARRRRKKVLKAARGFFGGRSKLFKSAAENLDRALAYAYTGRKWKKRDMRALWQNRIGAAVRPLGLSYSRFIHGLKKADVQLDRKVLAELAIRDPKDFAAIVHIAQQG